MHASRPTDHCAFAASDYDYVTHALALAQASYCTFKLTTLVFSALPPASRFNSFIEPTTLLLNSFLRITFTQSQRLRSRFIVCQRPGSESVLSISSSNQAATSESSVQVTQTCPPNDSTNYALYTLFLRSAVFNSSNIICRPRWRYTSTSSCSTTRMVWRVDTHTISRPRFFVELTNREILVHSFILC